MNGEPRDPAVAAEMKAPAPRPAASTLGEQPLLEPINTGGVIRTTIGKEDTKLAPLFTETAATDFRARWDLVQRSFVDNPSQALHDGDELVAQVIESLAKTFSGQRSELENELSQSDQPSTENLRLALRRHRSFFERLLSI